MVKIGGKRKTQENKGKSETVGKCIIASGGWTLLDVVLYISEGKNWQSWGCQTFDYVKLP